MGWKEKKLGVGSAHKTFPEDAVHLLGVSYTFGWECPGSLTSGRIHGGPKIKVKQFCRCLDLGKKKHLPKENTGCIVNYTLSCISLLCGRLLCGAIFQKVLGYRLMACVCII